jgi:hypothetical protein
VVTETDGAPEDALFPFVLPIAPEPLVPVVSTPLKLTIVIDAATLCDRVAVTVAEEITPGANARQISVVPSCEFVRLTSAQLTPAPLTPVTVIPDEFASVAINASNNSLPDLVENPAEVMLLAALDRSVDAITSVASAPNAGADIRKTAKTTARCRLKMSIITLGGGSV